MQPINERTSSSVYTATTTSKSSNDRRDILVPNNLNLDVSATTGDLSDDVFHASKTILKVNTRQQQQQSDSNTNVTNDSNSANQSFLVEDGSRNDFNELLLFGYQNLDNKKRKVPYGFMSQSEIRTTGKCQPIGDENDIDTTSLLVPLVSDQALGALDSPASLKLKRSQAFTDLPTMDDFTSPATFRRHSNQKSSVNNSSNNTNNNINAIEASLDDSNHVAAYIEEKKVVVPGIKVRAAKVSKLVQILMDSFNSSGHVLPGTDFPRVFILMHKWFMESITLTEILFDLYNLYNQYQEYYTQQSDKQYYANQQLKICYAFK